MAAISDAELLRKIFNHSATKPITHHMASDALSPRPYERRREIIARLIAQDEMGWVHTHAGRVISVEDFQGVRRFEEAGDVYISKTNQVTTDRDQRAHSNNGSMSYLFLRNPAAGLSLWDVEDQVTRAKQTLREEREAAKRERATSPIGQAEEGIRQAFNLEEGAVHISEFTPHVLTMHNDAPQTLRSLTLIALNEAQYATVVEVLTGRRRVVQP